MKPILLLSLTAALLSPTSFAQRGPVALRPASPATVAQRPQGPFPSFGFRTRRDHRSNAAAVWAVPLPWMNPQFSDDSSACDGGQQSAPPWPLLDPEPVPIAPPDPPARAVIHEYNWPAAPLSAPFFSIVLKDGQVRRAAAVWRTGGVLNFSGADGRAGSLKFDAVDLASTRRLNAEAGLTWPSALQ